jgi:hypothetical protein
MSEDFNENLAIAIMGILMGSAMAFGLVVWLNVRAGKAPGKTWSSWKTSVIEWLIVTVVIGVMVVSFCFQHYAQVAGLLRVLRVVSGVLLIVVVVRKFAGGNVGQ